MQLLAQIITTLLATNGGQIKELAPGIFTYFQSRPQHSGLLNFQVWWDPELWQMGKQNPHPCHLKLEFEYLDGLTSARSPNLVWYLKNTMIPLKAGLKFHKESKNFELVGTLTFSETKPCLN